MLFGALVLIVAGVLVYNYFSGIGEEAQEEVLEVPTEEYTLQLDEQEGRLVPAGLPVEHAVSSGEHLWGISEKYYGNGYNWLDIAQVNNLKNPGLIFSGQDLTIPKVALRVPSQIAGASSIASSPDTITEGSYTVVRGDTLWSIAVRAYQDGYQWTRIYQANTDIVSNPDIIEIGMEVTLPR